MSKQVEDDNWPLSKHDRGQDVIWEEEGEANQP